MGYLSATTPPGPRVLQSPRPTTSSGSDDESPSLARRHSSEALVLGSTWKSRKSAMFKRTKTDSSVRCSPESRSDGSSCSPTCLSSGSWEQRRSALIRSSSGQSPRRSPRVRRNLRVRRASSARSAEPKKPEQPVVSRWQSEPKLGTNSSEDDTKMCRWQSSPRSSPQARRPVRGCCSKQASPATGSPRFPQNSDFKGDVMPRSLRRPVQPSLDLDGDTLDCGRELEQIKLKMKGVGTAA